MKPKKKLHNHNSIPGYYDGLEDECYMCFENHIIKQYDAYILERLEEIRFCFSGRTFDDVVTQIDERINNLIKEIKEG